MSPDPPHPICYGHYDMKSGKCFACVDVEMCRLVTEQPAPTQGQPRELCVACGRPLTGIRFCTICGGRDCGGRDEPQPQAAPPRPESEPGSCDGKSCPWVEEWHEWAKHLEAKLRELGVEP
jgi:hypothetical protein